MVVTWWILVCLPSVPDRNSGTHVSIKIFIEPGQQKKQYMQCKNFMSVSKIYHEIQKKHLPARNTYINTSFQNEVQVILQTLSK